MDKEKETSSIVLGGGCFWCLEAIFLKVKGVESVVSGYAGGDESAKSPTYEQVCKGETGHAEVIKITFNESEISLENILRIFFSMHDPTTLNKQGGDIGTQYRSIILYNSPKQRDTAEEILREIAEKKLYGNSMLVTELKKLVKFYEAEEHHQRYFEKNPDNIYCQLVIGPKIGKFRNEFQEFFK